MCRKAHFLFTLFVFVCVWWCPAHIVLCCVFVLFFFALLSVSQHCPFLIAPSVISSVYYLNIDHRYLDCTMEPSCSYAQICRVLIMVKCCSLIELYTEKFPCTGSQTITHNKRMFIRRWSRLSFTGNQSLVKVLDSSYT
jgi:hypothetical protein